MASQGRRFADCCRHGARRSDWISSNRFRMARDGVEPEAQARDDAGLSASPRPRRLSLRSLIGKIAACPSSHSRKTVNTTSLTLLEALRQPGDERVWLRF